MIPVGELTGEVASPPRRETKDFCKHRSHFNQPYDLCTDCFLVIHAITIVEIHQNSRGGLSAMLDINSKIKQCKISVSCRSRTLALLHAASYQGILVTE